MEMLPEIPLKAKREGRKYPGFSLLLLLDVRSVSPFGESLTGSQQAYEPEECQLLVIQIRAERRQRVNLRANRRMASTGFLN